MGNLSPDHLLYRFTPLNAILSICNDSKGYRNMSILQLLQRIGRGNLPALVVGALCQYELVLLSFREAGDWKCQ